MNDRDRDKMETLIGGMGEVKSELVALTRHMETQNGSLARHFREDIEWQQTHSIEHNVRALTQAHERGVAEGRASALSWVDKAILRWVIPVGLACIAAYVAFLKG